MLNLDFLAIRESDDLSIFNLLSYLSVLSCPLPAVFVQRRKYKLAIWSSIPLLVSSVLVGGSRQPVVVALYAMLFATFPNNRYRTWVFVFIAVFALPYLEVFLLALKVMRNAPGFEQRIDVVWQFLTGTIDYSGTSNDLLDIRYTFYDLVERGTGIWITHFNYLYRELLFWLPSFVDVLGLKPHDFEYDIFATLMGGRVGSMHPTYFGTLFADAGWLFFPWPILTLGAMFLLEKNVVAGKPSNALYYWNLLLYVAMMWSRGSIYGPTVVLFVAFVYERTCGRIVVSIMHALLRRPESNQMSSTSPHAPNSSASRFR